MLKSSDIKYVFMHTYHGDCSNWDDVMFGTGALSGRWSLTEALADAYDLKILYSVMSDEKSYKVLSKRGICIGQATNTSQEAKDLANWIQNAGVIVVSSRDHLSRCVREHEKSNSSNFIIYKASMINYSVGGLEKLQINEHNKQ